MTNERPWGPHGPPASPHEVKPNPTAPGGFQNIGGGDMPPFADGGGGGGRHWMSEIAFSVLMVPFVWPFWTCLYPLTAAAGISAGLLSTALLRRVLSPEDVQVASAFGVLLAFGVIAIVSRVEHRLAEGAPFQKGRHAMRLFLSSVFIPTWFIGFMGDAEVRRTSFSYLSSLLYHPLFLVRHLTNPVTLAIAVGFGLGMHLLLTKATRLRGFWHWRLMWLGLK